MEDKKILSNEELEKVSGGTDFPANDIVSFRALAEIGKPYVWGAAGPEGYDDAGLVSYCISGTYVHTYTASMLLNWERVSDPQPGDICTNGSHCGIYIGNGSMVHVPCFGQKVSISPVSGGMIIVRRKV